MDVVKEVKRVANVKGLTEAGAAAAGLAATGWLESNVFRALPGVFGTNDGESAPSNVQNIARGVFRAGEAFTGLVMASKGRGLVRTAGYGVTAGGAWHLVRQAIDSFN